MNTVQTLGFIGSGNMAEALCRGVLRCGLYPADHITASDISPERRELFASLGVQAVASSRQVLDQADVVILAVKPQHILTILAEVQDGFRSDHLVISIAAGTSSAAIEQYTGEAAVVRVMPNTPMLLGKGASALAAGSRVEAEQLAAARRIFEAGGVAVAVEEELMDAVTALSGSGPAYFFYIAEILTAAACDAGLSEEAARTLLFETIKGAAYMLAESGKTAAQLREMVTSPGGTTAAALSSFEQNDLKRVMTEGFLAAAERSQQLSKEQ